MLIVFKLKTELSITWFSLLLLNWLKEFLNAVSGKHGLAKDTHNFNDWSANFEFVFNDCNETVCDDCNVYLYSDCVLRFSPKLFDLEMLLNPLEKYFDLPSVLIQECNFLCCKIKVVRVVSEHSLKIVDRLMNETEVFRLLSMCYCYICKFPKRITTSKLAKHKNLQVVPIRHRPTFSSVIVLGEYAPELSLRKKLGYLCKKRTSLYAYLLRFRIRRKGRDFKTRTLFGVYKPLCIREIFLNLTILRNTSVNL